MKPLAFHTACALAVFLFVLQSSRESRKSGYCLVKPQRFAATLLSQHPVDKHILR